eukprot:gene9518-10506_t
MRNLKLLRVDRIDTSIEDLTRSLIIDNLCQKVFFTTATKAFSFSPVEKKVTDHVSISDGEIVSIENLIDDELLIVAASNGDLYEWRYSEGLFECIATMGSGIHCMSWSPDQEIMILATGDNKLVLMNRNLDPLFETDLNPTEFGEAELITVGWGKKETQFHGQQGKPKPEDLKQKTADPVLPWDDRKIRICWCEDGQYFAVSSVDPQTGSRKLRVRSREGALFSTNEVIQGLEHSLDWKPSGNLLASSQRKPNKHDIVFIEKNGLTHGEFTLPFKRKQVEVVEIRWNKSSDVLAVWLKDLAEENDSTSKKHFLSYVQLWTRGNYHWYLKQELRFSDHGQTVSCVQWDADVPLRLHVICADGCYHNYTWHWTVSQSKESCVAVVDGANLLLTPFAKAVVPPPMSMTSVTLKSPVNQVCFGNSATHATVLLSDGSLQYLSLAEEITTQSLEVTHENTEEDQKCLPDKFELTHLAHWFDNSYIAVTQDSNSQDVICYLTRHNDNSVNICNRNIVSLDGKMHSIAVNCESSCVAIQMDNGEVLTCEREDGSFAVKPWITPFGSVLRFPRTCESISVCTINHTDVIIGRTERFHLYIDEKQIADNCTSFGIHEEYLVYTTHAHSLRCVHLESLVKWLLGGETSDPVSHEAERSVERGSRIVSVLSQDTKVILQMPRGNLETIHPRVLVVSFLKKLLDKLAYRKALNTMKRHRINLNLIHDHNPELFLSNVDAFITEVNSEVDVNLFLADLTEDDVTSTFYACSYAQRPAKSDETSKATNKVDRVCLTVRQAIERLGHNKLLLTFLTTYVKQTSPDLETVLIEMKKIKDKVYTTDTSFDRALKHVLYMTDVEDPKEYLPFLNEMKSYEDNYGKFKIDCYLKRYKKALKHIFNCGESHFEEFLNFLSEKALYKEGLELCKNDPDNFKSVSFLYGQDLAKRKNFLEAGLVYARVGYSEESLECFVRCANWKLALCEVSKLQYSKDKISQMARNMAVELKDAKRWSEAAFLLEVYVEDHESAISACIDGHNWDDAMRMIYRCKREDLMETNFIPAIMEAFRHCFETIEDAKRRFTRQKQRLVVVRELKEKQALEANDDGFKDEGENDLFSEASSMSGFSAVSASSKGSRMTGHSSKSRRKFKRKKYSLKEGSKYEEFALMEALAQIVNSIDQLQDGISSLLQALVLFSKQIEACQLQKSLHDCISLIKDSMDEIWNSKILNNHKNITIGPSTTVTSIVSNFLSNKQQMLPDSNIEDLPPLTQPVLRTDIHWQLSVLS